MANEQKKLTATEILAYLNSAKEPQTKNEIARAFGLKGDERIAFKKTLKDMEKSGQIVKHPGGRLGPADGLPGVGIVEVTDVTIDGDVYGRPTEWSKNKGEAPRVELMPDKKGHPSYAKGDRVLARIQKQDGEHVGRTMRRLDTPQNRVLGVIEQQGKGYVLVPSNKKDRNVYDVHESDLNGAKKGQIVMGEIQSAGKKGRQHYHSRVRITEVIGNMNDPKAISLIAIHEMGLRSEFTAATIAETKNMQVPGLKGREDLRAIPLITIDPADARDRDDAVYAEQLPDGSHHLVVAIADVAHYVRQGSELDKEAYARGNSTYFPDRVVPMLPEQLSNNLCSLAPRENRACLAVHMWISPDGQLTKYKFVRGLMNSLAALSYEQAQAAIDGTTDDTTKPLLDPVLKPLWSAYKVLRAAREKRGALDLQMPERRIVVDEKGNMTGVKQREHFAAHEVIEEFMVLANVAAASALEDKGAACMYRVHDKPSPQKLENLSEYLDAFGVSLPKGQSPKPGQLNDILKKVENHPFKHLVNEAMLRSQAQAQYSPDNIGHYGLALEKYAHFTSPIRRYADLIVHRSLIDAFNLGNDGIKEVEKATMGETAVHISTTERASAEAERNAVDRFTAAFLSERIGSTFSGRIRGVTRFGLFVALADTGADGLVPIRMLPQDQYVHDERRHALIGRRSGRIFRLGAPVTVKIMDADGLTGSTVLELVGAENGADIPGANFRDDLPLPPFEGRGGSRHGRGNRRRGGPRPS
jgi:ribonuclease R